VRDSDTRRPVGPGRPGLPGRILLAGTLFAAWAAATASAQGSSPAQAPPSLSDSEKERFLLEGKIVRRKSAPGGVTLSERATLRLGDLEHDCHIQRIDEHKTSLSVGSTLEVDFHDSFRNNVAAYRIDRMLGLGMIPVTVVRRDQRSNKPASYTWWVDDVLMVERERYEKKIPAPNPTEWNRQIFVVRLFDQLIYNFDRNLGNLVIDKSWRMWMIDHTRAFKVFKELREEKNLSATCEADLLARLRTLEKHALVEATRDLLTEGQVDGLLGRRDTIVRIYEQRIAAKGEAGVLYHLPSRLAAVPAAP